MWTRIPILTIDSQSETQTSSAKRLMSRSHCGPTTSKHFRGDKHQGHAARSRHYHSQENCKPTLRELAGNLFPQSGLDEDEPACWNGIECLFWRSGIRSGDAFTARDHANLSWTTRDRSRRYLRWISHGRSEVHWYWWKRFRGSPGKGLMKNSQWQSLIALHKQLLHEHHDFFLAPQHHSVSLALSRLDSKYKNPVKMFHDFLLPEDKNWRKLLRDL